MPVFGRPAQEHLVWATTTLGVPEYLAWFASAPEEVGRRRLEEVSLADLTDRWAALGLISAGDIEKLNDAFLGTRRSYLNVVSGFQLTREWPMATVIEWEVRGGLETEIIEALAVPLATCGQRIPAAAGGW